MMQPWFEDAKLGIFIHYGIYSVNGVAESWYFRYAPQALYKPYMKQINGFRAEKYDAEKWAELFKAAGARYAVLTSKHHDGVALFDTQHSDLSVVKSSPCGRDLLAPYCDALRKNGIRVGIYFTQCDWSHPDYTAKTWKPEKYFIDKYFNHSKKWNSFKKFHRAQLTEILKNYGDVDLLWFDGDWERSQADWDMKGLKEWLTQISPKTVINSRIGSYGDYATPEQQMPTLRPDGPWEYCMTINDSWGYQPKDKHFKSPEQIIRIFSNVICMGGNLLLDVGPKSDGTILPEQEDVLRKLGEFTHANEKAIWGTKGIDSDIFYGGLTISEDEKTLYCFQYGIPNGQTALYIDEDDVDEVSVVSTSQKLDIIRDGEKVWFEIPHDAFIYGTAVIEVKLRKKFGEVRKDG